MPDTPDFDDARRALDEVPVPDLWADAQRRAAGDAVVPLSVSGGRGRHPGRWLAVAAATALAVGTVAVLVDDDDQSVDTSPRVEAPSTDGITTYQEGEADCAFGVSGEPLDVPTRLHAAGDLLDGTNIEGNLGDQTFRIDVPAQVVRDFVGERIEDVELKRGTAKLWLSTDFVQVRSFASGQGACGSFGVTVSGGSEDGNRHAAIDLADRILLPAEIGAEEPGGPPGLVGTAWQLESSTVGGVNTDGNGSTFAFGQNEVQWSDGCNDFGAMYQQPDPTVLVVTGDAVSTDVSCDPNPTSDAIAAVMAADRIDLLHAREFVTLSAGDIALTLRPLADDRSGSVTTSTEGTTTTTTSDVGGVQGTVVSGPTCPVETPDEPCPPEPLATQIVALDEGGIVAVTESDADGHYAMDLPAGSFTLRANPEGGLPSCPDVIVTIPARTRVVADIVCDTGIR